MEIEFIYRILAIAMPLLCRKVKLKWNLNAAKTAFNYYDQKLPWAQSPVTSI